MGLAVALIYSYFKGNFNEKDAEKEVAREQAVEVEEINEVRFAGSGPGLSQSAFDTLCAKSLARFPSGQASYGEFIAFVLQESRGLFSAPASAHLLDRVVWKQLARRQKLQQQGVEAAASADVVDATAPLPVAFLLTVLNIAVKAPPADRAASLFLVAQREEEANSSSSSSSVSILAATVLIQHLADSCQLPSEKQVLLAGKYPMRTYRKKNAADMVQAHREAEAAEAAKEAAAVTTPGAGARGLGGQRIDREEFVKLILGKQVCAWAECYRQKG